MEAERHVAVMQWKLRDSGPLDGAVNIQVGTVTDAGWYVWHQGFGRRQFADKQDAWSAVRALMDQHEGRWERVEVDPGPFLTLCPADGPRVLYDTDRDESLYACWGRQKDKRWDTYLAAINAGTTLRCTETHALLGGSIELIEYRDPLDDRRRYAVSTAISEGTDWLVVDYPERARADAAYEQSVYDNVDDEFPFKSSHIIEVTVDRASEPPDGLTVLPSGEVIDTGDLEEYYDMYGWPPPRLRWPRTTELAVAPGPVSGMAAPRDWGPVEVSVRDVTPAAWQGNGELPPHALALAALPDGRQLLASGDDAAAHLWSIGDGRPVRTIAGHSEWVLSVALTVLSDGRVVLATGGKDRLARVWTAREGDALQELKGHNGPVNSVAWACPPGEVPWLVTGSDDAMVRIWEVETGQMLAALPVGAPSIDIVWSVAAAVLSDGHVCVVAGVDNSDAPTVHVWDAMTGATLHQFTMDHDDPISNAPKVAVATLRDRSFRVAAVAGSAVRIWDGHTGEVVRTLSAPMDRAGDLALAVLPDLRVAAAATDRQQTVVWDVESGSLLTRVDHAVDSFAKAVALVARPDGGLLLATGRERETPARLLRLDLRW